MIKVNQLSKRFKRYKRPVDRLKEVFFRRCYHQNYQALKDISFTVPSGQTLGILGKNGAGKSTLLKIISGVLLADEGDIQVSGRITGLLELGTGFDKELSGLQNIENNGLLIGMRKEEIAQQQQNIIDFSELGDFIHEPLRTYSSGMVMRLAFSIAMYAKPDCFLIDEALSVGDAHFQQKCINHIRAFKKNGGSIIFVSHDLNAIKMICDLAIVLDQGEIVAQGSAEHAVNHYNRIMARLDEEENKSFRAVSETSAQQNFGNRKATITGARLVGEQSGSAIVSSGEMATLTIDVLAADNIDNMTIGLLIRDRFGQDVFGTNSHYLGASINVKQSQQYQANFEVKMDIAPGKYSVTLALHSQESHIDDCYHWVDNEVTFEVAGVVGYQFSGVCRLPTSLNMSAKG